MAKFRFSVDKQLIAILNEAADGLARAATATMDDITLGLKNELRAQVESAGLGSRVANTWRGERFPDGGRISIDAAAFVWSKAPKIADAFDRAPVIRPVNGARYLAIPTDNVPRTRGSSRGGLRRMTPAEVETFFHQNLKFIRTSKGRLLAYIDAVGTASGSFKRASGKQLAQLFRTGKAPRHVQVVMFILTPAARMPKRLNVDQAANHWAGMVPPILERRIGDL